ncbi:DUF421 domain-containing protein [Desertibacillus haloalkaliphilus]|uniref:DUF421 domain-containing protein n=1 Tax=Desertibacillus haloalkaliphilus TaxID=1328930 RepID=UPI001C271992|nr:YetF domain-containing protein [Desertibacillus haloalkaliphilus]MBU8907897.1 DUF421 domain-containing protein [Desertibacillus haloalkaliphilus]
MEYLLAFAKAIGMFFVGLTAFRFMGSQAVGRLTDYDLVIAIAIGALIAKPLSDPALDPWISVIAIFALVLLQFIISWITLKSTLLERIIMGRTTKVIENGSIIMSGLRRARMTKSELNEELRAKGFQSASEVDKAFLEPSGKFSVIEKQKTNDLDIT